MKNFRIVNGVKVAIGNAADGLGETGMNMREACDYAVAQLRIKELADIRHAEAKARKEAKAERERVRLAKEEWVKTHPEVIAARNRNLKAAKALAKAMLR